MNINDIALIPIIAAAIQKALQEDDPTGLTGDGTSLDQRMIIDGTFNLTNVALRVQQAICAATEPKPIAPFVRVPKDVQTIDEAVATLKDTGGTVFVSAGTYIVGEPKP